jgi:hypothetical protein
MYPSRAAEKQPFKSHLYYQQVTPNGVCRHSPFAIRHSPFAIRSFVILPFPRPLFPLQTQRFLLQNKRILPVSIRSKA